MTTQTALSRRLLRRETRATRRGPAVAVAVVLTVILLVLLAGAIAWAVDGGFRAQAATVIAPVATIAGTPSALIGVGVLLVLLALLLIGLAVVPGRRARRTRFTARTALAIDDGVLADAIADGVARRLGMPRGQVAVTVARRAALVRITPTSGVPVARADAEDAANRVLGEAGFPLAPRVQVAREGVIS